MTLTISIEINYSFFEPLILLFSFFDYKFEDFAFSLL